VLIKFIPLIIGAYLLGSIPTAYLVAKWRRGIDIRNYGSGNVGASNVLTTVSKRWSVLVMIVDIGKGILPVWAAQLLGLGAAQQAAAGILAIVGHNWPIFLHFQGGRGVFTMLGTIIMLSPWLGLIALVFPYLFFAPFKQVSLGVTITLVLLPILSGTIPEILGISDPLPVVLGTIGMMLILMFRRLIAPRTEISASTPTHELIVNRILFDRDIRDRKAWIHQKRQSGAGEEE